MTKKQNNPLPGLIDEHPILVYPKLAAAIGLNEAIICQQLHYLLNSVEEVDKTFNYVDGHWWVYFTLEEWHDKYFGWVAIGTVGRLFRKLETKGLIVSMQSVKNPSDRTKWYRIDHEKWLEIIPPIVTNCNHQPSLQNVTIKNTTNCNDGYNKTLVKEEKKKEKDLSTSKNEVDTGAGASGAANDDILFCKECRGYKKHAGGDEQVMCDDCQPALTDEQAKALEYIESRGTISGLEVTPNKSKAITSIDNWTQYVDVLIKNNSDKYTLTDKGRAALEAWQVQQPALTVQEADKALFDSEHVGALCEVDKTAINSGDTLQDDRDILIEDEPVAKKPRTAKQLASDAIYNVKVAILEAVFDAMNRVRPPKIDTKQNLGMAGRLVDLEATPEMMDRYYGWLAKHYAKNEYDLTFNSMFKDENWQKFYKQYREYEAIPLSPNVGEVEAQPTPPDTPVHEITDEELEAAERKAKTRVFGIGLEDAI